MKISSPAFEHNDVIPIKFTCDGENINPPLVFSEIPANTASLALVMDDPDVPKSIRPDGMWDHWVLFNIPPATSTIREGETAPDAVSGANSSGLSAYQGPCPPDREHRYFFRLHALDTKLDLMSGASKKEVLSALEGHIIESAELIGRYKRQ